MTELNKIRWQCRRGSLELDLLVQNYLQNYYPYQSPQQQAHFVALLQLDDAELLTLMPALLEQDLPC